MANNYALPNRQYVGARYVPKFSDPISWDINRSYEPLTIVTYLNNSYTSKLPVPVGVDITNEEYWVVTGNYNAQVEEYRQAVEELKNKFSEASIGYPTVADMIDDTKLKVGIYVSTSGYQHINDHGGCIYQISNVSSGYSIALKNGLYANMIIPDIVTPQMFGAYGDNTHDDSTAIQLAINNSDSVYIPNGKYSVNTPIIINKRVNIRGDGFARLTKTSDTTTNNYAFYIEKQYNISENTILLIGPPIGSNNIRLGDVSISGLELYNNYTNSFLIYAAGCFNLKINNIVSWSSYNSLNLETSWGCIIKDCMFSTVARSAFKMWKFNNNYIENCYCGSNAYNIVDCVDTRINITNCSFDVGILNFTNSYAKLVGIITESAKASVIATNSTIVMNDSDLERHQDTSSNVNEPIFYFNNSKGDVKNTLCRFVNYSGQTTWDQLTLYHIENNSMLDIESYVNDFPKLVISNSDNSVANFKNLSELNKSYDYIYQEISNDYVTGEINVIKNNNGVILTANIRNTAEITAQTILFTLPYAPYIKTNMLLFNNDASNNVRCVIDTNGNVKCINSISANEYLYTQVSYGLSRQNS